MSGSKVIVENVLGVPRSVTVYGTTIDDSKRCVCMWPCGLAAAPLFFQGQKKRAELVNMRQQEKKHKGVYPCVCSDDDDC